MENDKEIIKYSEKYSKDSFWVKVKSFSKIAGKEIIEKSLQLYYVLDEKDVPLATKTIILGSLAYFIAPIDVIPDVLVGIGYTDDLGVLVSAIAVANKYINDNVRNKATEKLKEWFD